MSDCLEWGKLLQKVNVNGQIKDHLERSAFVKDQDKIIFSGAFRRMSRKTQVHPMAINDHVHNRLTHSLEVANVGRSLGALVEKKLRDGGKQFFVDNSSCELGEIVRAACLAHDIGNPPFGHAGESAIQGWAESKYESKYEPKSETKFEPKLKKEVPECLKELLNDLKFFDGNAMGFRVLTTLEYHSFSDGMRLSYPTLASTLKYPWGADKADPEKKKFSCFYSEKEILHNIADELGLKINDKIIRHPLSYLVEAADDICYSMLDLEDACEMGLISAEEFYAIAKDIKGYDVGEDEVEKAKDLSKSRQTSLFRGTIINKLIEDVTDAFVEHYFDIMHGLYQNKDRKDLIDGAPHANILIENAKKLCRKSVYTHARKIEIEIGAYRCIECMLDLFYEASKNLAEVNAYNVGKQDHEKRKPEFKTQRVVDQSELTERQASSKQPNEIMGYFIDYLSGMTDNYATHVSMQFRGRGDI